MTWSNEAEVDVLLRLDVVQEAKPRIREDETGVSLALELRRPSPNLLQHYYRAKELLSVL